METPISEDEARAQGRYIDRALEAAPEERRSTLVEALLAYGHRFLYGLEDHATAAEQAKGANDRIEQIADEFRYLLASWISGVRLTARADEGERRAAEAVLVAQLWPELGAVAASAIIDLPEGNPQRDVDLARRLLEEYRLTSEQNPTGESALWAVTVAIELDKPDEDDLAERVEEGLAHEVGVDDPLLRRHFRVVAAGRYLDLAVAASELDDRESPQRLAEQGIALLEDLDPDGGVLGLLGAFASFYEDGRKAAETYHRILDDPTVSSEMKLVPALLEARLRYGLGEHDRVVALLAPRLAAYEMQYLTAVAEEDVQAEGERFGEATINLAFSHAHFGNWHDAVAVLDRGKSRRARYRAALRSAPDGAEILACERDLYALDRGAVHRPPVLPDAHLDALAAGVAPRASLLELYRSLRPRLEENDLSTPSLAEIAGVLADNEAALILGQRSDGMMLVAVRPDDTTAPALARLVPLSARPWVEALAPEEGYGWLTGRAVGAVRGEVEAALSRLLDVADELMRPTVEQLHAIGVRRLVVVPHRLLHHVPFWAVPSLSRFVVETAPSVAALVSARSAPAPSMRSRALAVVNPTADLRIAGAEGDAVGRHLAALGIQCTRLTRSEATEIAVVEALAERPGIMHFCGHGISDPFYPERSALLISPAADLTGGAEDPFVAWMSAVPEWRDDGDVRAGDVPGVGRVIEKQTDQGFERRLEYGTHGTLWALYEHEQRIAFAELWSAGDMLVGRDLDGCAVAVLSACESGSGALGATKLDEAAGLPAALQLAGAASVVATLWPIGDAESAIFVDELYGELVRYRGVADLAAIVHSVRERLREMPRDAAIDRAEMLRARTTDPVARFALERFIRDLSAGDERPFSEPYAWAPFFVSGTSKVKVREGY